MSFSLRQGLGGSHQFERQDSNTSSSWVGLCHKCSRPFIPALTQTPVCCRACHFVACQGCASNQADWESKYRCASAKTSVLTYQDLEDIGEPQERARTLPPSVQDYRKQLMAKHDQLLDCIRELRATTHKYREEVESAFRACADEMGDGEYSDHDLGSSLTESSSTGAGNGRVPRKMIELVDQRLMKCTRVLLEQAKSACDLTSVICESHSPASPTESLKSRLLGSDAGGQATMLSPAFPSSHRQNAVGSLRKEGGDLSNHGLNLSPNRIGERMGGMSVTAVPIVGGAYDSNESVNVARLLHKVYQYRTDSEIEEGFCARLSTLLDQQACHILPQVERMLPALTKIIVYSETEMGYLTREIVRLCTSSLHLASRFMWCLRTILPKEPGFSEHLQYNICMAHFESPLEERLAKILWLATIAISLNTSGNQKLREERWEEEYQLLELAVEPGFNKYKFKQAVFRALRLNHENFTSRALLTPFVLCSASTVPPHSCLVLSVRQELAVVTEPMQQRLTLPPGRYTLEVTNLDNGGGSTRVAKVLFALELPGCPAEALTEDAASGESVVLTLEVASVPLSAEEGQKRDGGAPGSVGEAADSGAARDHSEAKQEAKVRVMVQWRDDYQLAFAVRLVVRMEQPDFNVHSAAEDERASIGMTSSMTSAASSRRGDVHCDDGSRVTGGRRRKQGGAGVGAADKEDDLERAIRLSMETHRQEACLVSRAQQALRAVAQQHKMLEELVEVSRHLVRYRRTVLAGAGFVFARSGEVDSTKMLLNRELHKRIGELNRCLPRGAYMMMGSSMNALEEILGFVVDEAKSLQTPHKVHYMLTVEVRRVPDRTCAQAGEGWWRDDMGTREVPYLSSQPYEMQAPAITRVKGGQPASSGNAVVRGHNALVESFVVVKDELQEGDTLVVGAGSHSNSSKNRPTGMGQLENPNSRSTPRSRIPSDSSCSPFGISWEEEKEAVRQRSGFACEFPGEWDCRSVIVKSHDDLRQDQLAAELLFLFDRCFKTEMLDLPLRPYAVLATSEDGGILETITDALAIDTLKKKMSSGGVAVTFAECFEKVFGTKGSKGFLAAQGRFVSSMAAYSVFCYVLHVKDRHNGNIMLCRDGSIAHVDFGIMLNVRYAKDVLELKIKLSSEFVQVIGDKMDDFEDACRKGYLAIRKHSQELFQMLEMSSFSAGAGTVLPCLEGDAVEEVKKRLKLNSSDHDAQLHMSAELQKAKEHFSTGLLDQIHNWTHANV